MSSIGYVEDTEAESDQSNSDGSQYGWDDPRNYPDHPDYVSNSFLDDINIYWETYKAQCITTEPRLFKMMRDDNFRIINDTVCCNLVEDDIPDELLSLTPVEISMIIVQLPTTKENRELPRYIHIQDYNILLSYSYYKNLLYYRPVFVMRALTWLKKTTLFTKNFFRLSGCHILIVIAVLIIPLLFLTLKQMDSFPINHSYNVVVMCFSNIIMINSFQKVKNRINNI
jgi:hypothetical protein